MNPLRKPIKEEVFERSIYPVDGKHAKLSKDGKSVELIRPKEKYNVLEIKGDLLK